MLDCRTYRSADIGSDHELVVAKLRLKLGRKIKPEATRRLDVKKLEGGEVSSGIPRRGDQKDH